MHTSVLDMHAGWHNKQGID